MDPQSSLRTEYVALVSKRKEMDCPDTLMSTRGSLTEMTVIGSGEPGPFHSSLSMARARKSAGGRSVSDVRGASSGPTGQEIPSRL